MLEVLQRGHRPLRALVCRIRGHRWNVLFRKPWYEGERCRRCDAVMLHFHPAETLEVR